MERLLTLCPFWISRSPSNSFNSSAEIIQFTFPYQTPIHFAVPLHRYKIPRLFHWSHDLACLSTSPFPRGSSGLLWGWGSWWQIWGIWGDVTMAESESGEGVHWLFEALVVAAICLFLSLSLYFFYTHEGKYLTFNKVIYKLHVTFMSNFINTVYCSNLMYTSKVCGQFLTFLKRWHTQAAFI